MIRIAFVLSLSLALTLHSAETDSGEADMKHLDRISKRDEVDRSIDKGLAWVVKKQDPQEGHYQSRLKYCDTALASMALMASGHFPGRSKYGQNLRRGILYLVREVERNNGYYGKDGGRMYGHGICTLALCEAYGMMPNPKDNRLIRKALEPAIEIITRSQVKDKKSKHFGGWRYEPQPKDADLSVTVWQILALRSAQNCQIEVPKESIDDGINYVRRTFSKKHGAFTYQGNRTSASMRTAGIVSLMALGANKSEEDKLRIAQSGEFLKKFDPRSGQHFYYQAYYLATAANMLGGEYREVFLKKLQKALIKLQNKEGDFRKHTGHDGGVYATSFAIICLAVRYQYLPIYQE